MIKAVKWTIQCGLCGIVVKDLRSQPKFHLTTEQYPALDKSMAKLFGRSILVTKLGTAYWVELLGAHICGDCAKTLDVAFDEIEIRRKKRVW